MKINRRRVCPTLLAVTMSWLAAAPHGPAHAGTFDIAITVDDMPAHGKLPPGMTRIGVAEAHLRAYQAHRVPEAFGFVNAARIKDEPDSEVVLNMWRKAGHPLGNHTYSHMNLEKAPSMEAWKADVVAGEPAVASRMAGADWRYLRFPNLNVGATRRTEALAFLRERAYRIADVSLSFSDYSYNDAYARCMAKGDANAVAAMKADYLAKVDSGIAHMKQHSMQVFGKVIPQVLLTHLGPWGAATMPDLLVRLDAAGARYVTLAQAQSDPAYTEVGGGSVIARVAKARGITLAESGPGTREPLDLGALCQ